MDKRRINFEVNKMLMFMDHNAKEIEQNIDDSTEIYIADEKDKFIRTGIMKINQLYNKKMQILNRDTATMISTRMTSARLEISINRENHVKSILADVNEELKIIRKDAERYNPVLQKLILQAMYQILENQVNLILIPYDVPLVKSMVDELQETYKANTGMAVKINIDCSKLPIEEVGGVMITSKNRRLIVENTLVVRLLHVAQQAIPLIRTSLFGPNPTRFHSGDDKKQLYY